MTARRRAVKLYLACIHISVQNRSYRLGGGHTMPLSRIDPSHPLDCSSSTSLALARAGLFSGRNWSFASWDFARWGKPGRGKYFTVWYNWRHVWVEFHGIGRYFRFDTSPWGSGGYGPRMRVGRRPTTGFAPRHFPGL